MNTRIYCLVLAISIYLSSCNSYHEQGIAPNGSIMISISTDKTDKEQRILAKKKPDPTLAVEAQFIGDMKKQGFTSFIQNTNVFHNTIHEFGYAFSSNERGFSSFHEARAFIIKTSENLLGKFNNKTIQPYLKKYPIEIRDIVFMIVCDRNKSSGADITAIILNKGRITYRQNCLTPPQPSHKESYEEAKRLYDAEQKKAKEIIEVSNGSREQVDTRSLSFVQPREGQTL